MMGTAGSGVPATLGGVLGLEGFLILNAKQAAKLAAAPKYPAAYQHLPSPGAATLWDASASRLPVDLYSTAVARKLGLDEPHLASAVDFWSKLAFPPCPPAGPPYFSFIGTQQLTLTGHGYDGNSSGAAALRRQDSEDGGDGTVPIWSASRPELASLYVGGEHSKLFDEAQLQAVLLELIPPAPTAKKMLKAALKKRMDQAIDLSPRHPVFRAGGSGVGAPAKISVSLRIGLSAKLAGNIIVERKGPPGKGQDQHAWLREKLAHFRTIPIELPSPPPSYIAISIGNIADFTPGQYCVYFLPKEHKEPAGRCANFIIQENQ
jgi:hypothetical protein